MGKRFLIPVFMLVAIFISTKAFAYSVAYPQDGIYAIQPRCAPGKELSVQNHDRNWGANVIIDNINSGWQRWKIQRIVGTDFYSIIAVHSELAIDVANATAQNGINIATWPYLGGSQNQFKIWDAGNDYFVIQGNLNSNETFVLDVVNAENRAGANVWSYGFNGSDAQLWRLEMIQALPTFQPYNKTASQKVTAYVMPDLQATAGNEYVDAGDNVTVLREEGNAIFVRYPIRNSTKERWVNKNEIFGGGSTSKIPANLQNLINTYNNKTWRNHTYLADVKECKEFASFIFDKLYNVGYIGGGSTSDNPKNYLINLSNPGRVALRGYKTNLTSQSAQELFQNAQPGDFVQIRRRHGGPHSGIFVNRTSNGIMLFEANADGRNSIRTNSYSYNDLADKNFAMSLYYAK